MTYNNRANLHTVADALGHTTTYSDYNAFGQAVTVTDTNGIVTTRAYNNYKFYRAKKGFRGNDFFRSAPKASGLVNEGNGVTH